MVKTLYVLVGIPGSGKTTLRKKMISEMANTKVVNKDSIRIQIKKELADSGKNVNKINWKEIEKEVIPRYNALLQQYVEEGVNIIDDNTNLTMKNISRLQQFAKNNSYECEVIFLEDSWNVDLCHKRNTSRDVSEHVPVATVENMAENFIKVYHTFHNSNKITINSNPLAIVVDMDGTLAHMHSRSAFEWNRVGEDTVDETVKELVKFYHSQGIKVIICSGRDGCCKDISIKWLNDNGIPFDEFFIRPVNDMRKDVHIKYEIYVNNIMPKYDVKLAIDDRMQVCRLWRGLGLKCLQVDNGWF
jgi:predicted kinase